MKQAPVLSDQDMKRMLRRCGPGGLGPRKRCMMMFSWLGGCTGRWHHHAGRHAAPARVGWHGIACLGKPTQAARAREGMDKLEAPPKGLWCVRRCHVPGYLDFDYGST